MLVGLLVLLAMMWLAVSALLWLRPTSAIGLAGTLELDLAGCDVRLQQGVAAEVRVEAWLPRLKAPVRLDNDASGSVVSYVRVVAGGCDSTALGRCRAECLVSLRLPATGHVGTPKIKITQLTSDGSRPRIFAEGAVTLGYSLEVRGETLSVELEGVSTTGTAGIKVVLGDSSAYLGDGVLGGSGDVALHSGRGNVVVRYPVGHDLQVNSRSNNNYVCLRTAASQGTLTMAFDFAADTVGTTCAASATVQRLSLYYDDNRDGRVTVPEFKDALLKLEKCCGSSCPRVRSATNCDDLVEAIFSASTMSDARFAWLSGVDFAAAVTATTETSIDPKCKLPATITANTRVGAASLTLTSNSGAARLLQADTATAGGAALDTFRAEGQSAALRLLPGSYAELSQLREAFGDDSVDAVQTAVFATLVVRDPTQRFPDDVYVWATRVSSLTLTPALLSLFGASLLNPTLVTVHPEFVSGECSAQAYGPDDPVVQPDDTTIAAGVLRRAQVYAQLQRALTPLGQLRIKGALVRVELDDASLYGGFYLMLRPGVTVNTDGTVTADNVAGDVITGVEREFMGASQSVGLVVGLNLAIAGLVALVATYRIVRTGRRLLRERIEEFAVNFQVAVIDAAKDPSGTDVPLASREWYRSMIDPDTLRPFFNPFEQPFEMLLEMAPYRDVLLNSLDTFVRRQYEVLPSARVERTGWFQPWFCNLVLGSSRVVPKSAPEPEAPSTVPLLRWERQLEHTGLRLGLFRQRLAFFAFIQQLRPVKEQSRIRYYLTVTRRDAQLSCKFVYWTWLEGIRLRAQYTPFAQLIPRERWLELHRVRAELARDNRLLTEFLRDACVVAPADAHKGSYTTCQVGFERRLLEYVKFVQAPYDETGLAHAVRVASGSGRMLDGLGLIQPDLGPRSAPSESELPAAGPDYHAVLEPLGVGRTLSRVKVVFGLRPRGGIAENVFDRSFVIDAVIQGFFAVLPGLILLVYALMGQRDYASTTGAAAAQAPASMGECMRPPGLLGLDSGSLYVGTYAWTIAAFTSIVVGVAALMASYAGVLRSRGGRSRLPRLRLTLRVAFGAYLLVQTFVILWVLAATALWLLLAAILDPTMHLVHGVAVITVIVVVTRVYSKLSASRDRIVKKLSSKLDSLLLGHIKAKLGPSLQSQEQSQDLQIEDAVAVFDIDDDERLSLPEFKKLFVALNLSIDDDLAERMFAFADYNLSGTITREEFGRAWSYLRRTLVMKTLEEFGLDHRSIAKAIAIVLLVFLLM